MKKLITILMALFFISISISAFAECPEGYRVCARGADGTVVCCRNHIGGVQGNVLPVEEPGCLIAQNCTGGGFRCSPGITRCCSPFSCRALGKGAAQGPFVCQ